MEARLFGHGERGDFKDKDDLRDWLTTELSGIRKGMYALGRNYNVPSDSLAFFEMEGAIVGYAVIREGAHEMTQKEREFRVKLGVDTNWKAVMWVDPESIRVWNRAQDVSLREAGITFLPGPPILLTEKQVLTIFHLVAQRSKP